MLSLKRLLTSEQWNFVQAISDEGKSDGYFPVVGGLMQYWFRAQRNGIIRAKSALDEIGYAARSF